MRQTNITEQVIARYAAGNEAFVLDDSYRNYDSNLIVEDLQLHEIKGYLEKRADLRGGYVYYDYDEGGISTLWVIGVKVRHHKVLTTKGLVFIRNNSGRYDVHEFWRQ